MEKCAKCGQSYELHTIEEKIARLTCPCEQSKKCYKSGCTQPVTQAELVTGALAIVKTFRCEQHGFEELRPVPPVEVAPVAAIAVVEIAPVVEAVTPAAEVVAAPAVLEIAPLTQTVAENCFVVVDIEMAQEAVTAGEIESAYQLVSRSAPAMSMVTCVKCSDTHTLRSRTAVVVSDTKTNVGLHRTVCPKCDDSALFVIAPFRE